MFKLLWIRWKVSTSDHPKTDGQKERANRVLEEIIREYVHSFTNWSEFLPMLELTINSSIQTSTTHTPFFVNDLRHPRLPTILECDSCLRGGDSFEQTPIRLSPITYWSWGHYVRHRFRSHQLRWSRRNRERYWATRHHVYRVRGRTRWSDTWSFDRIL